MLEEEEGLEEVPATDHHLDLPAEADIVVVATERADILEQSLLDRKSTRLNSSHTVISYAVFCLKKKKNKIHPPHTETQTKKIPRKMT